MQKNKKNEKYNDFNQVKSGSTEGPKSQLTKNNLNRIQNINKVKIELT